MININININDFIKIFLPLILIILGCSGGPEVSFDASAWKEDRYGCNKNRLGIYEELIDHKNELLGLSSNRMVDILGKPDLNELFSRNQKFFIYRITPGKDCNSNVNTTREEQLFLVVRFNALGLANEIYLNDESDPTK